MAKRKTARPESLEAIALAATGSDDQRLRAFRDDFVRIVSLPEDAHVIGEPVEVVAIEYDGNARRGLTATCCKGTGSWSVGLAEVSFVEGSPAAQLADAYRRWVGIGEPQALTKTPAGRRKKHKAEIEKLPLDRRAELVVLSTKGFTSTARCRLLGTAREITLRSPDLWKAVSGEIVTVQPRKAWSYAGHPYLSGSIVEMRIDATALGLEPLRLEERGVWKPEEQYWGEEGEPLEEWATPIFERGPRPEYELEQVVPGDDDDPTGPLSDGPILEAIGLHEEGAHEEARRLLMELLVEDLRCLDAHAHLGNFEFGREHSVRDAIKHYEVGVRIGELSLPKDFAGLLPWGYLDNRPFLRCLHGYGLCLWRLGRAHEALAVFERMLWLNPTDNQGARILVGDIKAGRDWRPE